MPLIVIGLSQMTLGCLEFYKEDIKSLLNTGPLPAMSAVRQVLDNEVQGLISKNAVKGVKPVLGQYVSSYFAAPKSKRSPDKWRPIINLKRFNLSVRKIHFRMEEVVWIRQWLWSGGWFCGIDIKDAFLHVPIHLKFRKFLRFE